MPPLNNDEMRRRRQKRDKQMGFVRQEETNLLQAQHQADLDAALAHAVEIGASSSEFRRGFLQKGGFSVPGGWSFRTEVKGEDVLLLENGPDGSQEESDAGKRLELPEHPNPALSVGSPTRLVQQLGEEIRSADVHFDTSMRLVNVPGSRAVERLMGDSLNSSMEVLLKPLMWEDAKADASQQSTSPHARSPPTVEASPLTRSQQPSTPSTNKGAPFKQSSPPAQSPSSSSSSFKGTPLMKRLMSQRSQPSVARGAADVSPERSTTGELSASAPLLRDVTVARALELESAAREEIKRLNQAGELLERRRAELDALEEAASLSSHAERHLATHAVEEMEEHARAKRERNIQRSCARRCELRREWMSKGMVEDEKMKERRRQAAEEQERRQQEIRRVALRHAHLRMTWKRMARTHVRRTEQDTALKTNTVAFGLECVLAGLWAHIQQRQKEEYRASCLARDMVRQQMQLRDQAYKKAIIPAEPTPL